MKKEWHWVGREDGRSGMEWRFAITDEMFWVYIPGTDHPDDWRHHLKIGLVQAANGVWVTRADLALAAEVVRAVIESGVPANIGGHSWGGAIAALAVWMLRRRGWEVGGVVYGAKRAGNAAFVQDVRRHIVAYKHRGDPVLFLPPWQKALPYHVIGSWMWPWKAHGPDTYYKQMERDGFR